MTAIVFPAFPALAQAQSPASVSILSRVGDGSWQARPAVSAQPGQAVSLKVAPIEGANIRWYQIIPDVTQMYKNANFPWDPDPYKWVGFTRIRYAREELTKLRGRWEADIFRKGERGTIGAWTGAYATPFVRSRYYHEGPFDGHISVMRFKLADIKDKPISFSKKRKEATQEYILKHYGLQSSGIEIEPRMIIIHWTGTRTLESAWNTFNNEALPPDRSDIASGGTVNVSAHFLVGRDGAIYRLMPETWMARHVIGLNLSAVGIENIGGIGDAAELTDAQLAANARLVRYLKSSHPGIEFLAGHHEYLRFEGRPLWLEKDPQYRTRKSDPGPKFMSRLRRAVSDLELKGPP